MEEMDGTVLEYRNRSMLSLLWFRPNHDWAYRLLWLMSGGGGGVGAGRAELKLLPDAVVTVV